MNSKNNTCNILARTLASHFGVRLDEARHEIIHTLLTQYPRTLMENAHGYFFYYKRM